MVSPSQKLKNLGYQINTVLRCDYLGPCHTVKVTKNGKTITRSGRKYDDCIKAIIEKLGEATDMKEAK